jgi:formate/nitrite transporter
MADDTLYITPHEAALAVVATSMKKARLRLDTLIINSIVAGVLFSSGGMLALNAQAENPTLMKENPGIVHFMQGLVFPIGLFYVVIMGAELYNSNILYFTVGLCRGAVSILDLLVSWSVSWLFNMGANLFVCYCICNWSGVTRGPLYVEGSRALAETKLKASFFQEFIRGCAGNFFVCLAVYLQLLCKPIHVKLIVMALPIFTFVSMGFIHTVADMYLIPMGMFNGADISVGTYIWKSLIPSTIGNALGGAVFSIVVPFYLHLVVVERDREKLQLPTYEVKDEQPELQADSRVVRVVSPPSESGSDDGDEKDFNPVSYRPDSISRVQTIDSRLSLTHSQNSKLRSPPGVFPVMGMGKPLMREATIAGLEPNLDEEVDNEQSIDSASIVTGNSRFDGESARSISTRTHKELNKIQKEQEQEYVNSGGYNARQNTMGEALKRVVSRRPVRQDDAESDIGLKPIEAELAPKSSNSSNAGTRLFKSLSRSIASSRQPESVRDISHNLHKYKITPKAAHAADSIAGIDNYDLEDMEIARPQQARRKSAISVESSRAPTVASAPRFEANNLRESDEERSETDKASSGQTLA